MSSLFQEEFGYNADTQKMLAKNGETLLGAINFFIASVNTFVNKTIEDTLMTVKQYESARWVLIDLMLSVLQVACIQSKFFVPNKRNLLSNVRR